MPRPGVEIQAFGDRHGNPFYSANRDLLCAALTKVIEKPLPGARSRPASRWARRREGRGFGHYVGRWKRRVSSARMAKRL